MLLLHLHVRRDGEVLEPDPVAGSVMRGVGVIGHDERDVDCQLPRRSPVEEIDEAVIELRHHHERAGSGVLVPQPVRGSEVVGHRGNRLCHRVEVPFGLEAGSKGEQPRVEIVVLGVLEDVALDIKKCARQAVHDAWPVGTAQCEDVGVHGVEGRLGRGSIRHRRRRTRWEIVSDGIWTPTGAGRRLTNRRIRRGHR